MSVSIYIVAAPVGNAALTTIDGNDAVIVNANSAAEAVALAQSHAQGIGAGSLWDSAKALPTQTALTDLSNWTLAVNFSASSGTGTDLGVVTYTGVVGDTLASFMTNTAAAINAAGLGISHAAYTTGTLTVAGTADDFGVNYFGVTMTPPTASVTTNDVDSIGGTSLFTSTGPFAYSWAQSAVIGSITDHGSSSAALSVAITSAWGIPGVIAAYKQVVPLSTEYPIEG